MGAGGRQREKQTEFKLAAGSLKGHGVGCRNGCLSVVLALFMPLLLGRSCVECKSRIKRYVFFHIMWPLLKASQLHHLVRKWKM